MAEPLSGFVTPADDHCDSAFPDNGDCAGADRAVFGAVFAVAHLPCDQPDYGKGVFEAYHGWLRQNLIPF